MTNEKSLDDAELALLRALDTPTVCNALELLVPERRGHGFTVEPLVCPFPDLPPIVGYARTGSIRAAAPSGRTPEADRDMRLAYYDYMGSGTGPRITVLQDLDGPRRGSGAFWGEVNSNVHKALGCLGVITDGSVRDIPAVAEGFQMLAGSIGPSHAHVHVVDFGKQVTIAGMVVHDGDLIHADRHGAVVVPHAVARQVAAAAAEIAAKEAVILEVCRAPGFTYGKLKAAMTGKKDIH